MAQLDVHRNPNPKTAELFPFLLDVQNDLLSKLPTRVVVPLSSISHMSWELRQLNPALEIENQKVFMSTADMSSIYVRDLGEKVTSLADRREDILGAVDFLFCGF
jgi:toxin CcdB